MEREQLIIEKMPLVDKVYNKNFRNSYFYIDKDDLIQEGYIGLINGIDTYNDKKGKLNSYLYICIKNRMINYCNKVFKYKNEISLDEIIKD